MQNVNLSLGKVACFMIFCVLLSSTASKAQIPANSAYENQQRAVRVLQFEREIAELPDVEIRSQLRFNILEFIYSKEVRSQYAAAEPIVIAYFEEIAANRDELKNQVKNMQSRVAVLLRKYDPDTAKKIEAKYAPYIDTAEQDYQSFRPDTNTNTNLSELTDRAVERLNTQIDMVNTINIYERVRRQAPDQGNRILDAALKNGERNPSPNNAATLDRMIDQVLNQPAPTVSPEQRLRYYRILVAAAQVELTKPIPEGTYIATLWPLRRALPKIKSADQRLFNVAQSVVSRYRSYLSKDQLAREEADDRIEAAENQLEQAIAEAESASKTELKDYLWGWASQIALLKKNYRLAVDLLMKAGPTVGSANQPTVRDQRLTGIANRAQSYQDFETARYAVDLIKDDQIRATALLDYANDHGRMIEKDRPQMARLVDDAIGQIEKAGPNLHSVSAIGNSRSWMTLVKPFDIDGFTTRAVRIINQTPSNGADAKPGTPERKEFVMLSRNGMILCSASNFRPVWDVSPVPNPDLANQIKVKEWRLAAKIQGEMSRKYPPTQLSSEKPT